MSWFLQIEIPVDYVQWTNVIERGLHIVLTICIYRRVKDYVTFEFFTAINVKITTQCSLVGGCQRFRLDAVKKEAAGSSVTFVACLYIWQFTLYYIPENRKQKN
jgi:hypothetical protein